MTSDIPQGKAGGMAWMVGRKYVCSLSLSLLKHVSSSNRQKKEGGEEEKEGRKKEEGEENPQ